MRTGADRVRVDVAVEGGVKLGQELRMLGAEGALDRDLWSALAVALGELLALAVHETARAAAALDRAA
jgi:hypothetical protein